MKIAGIAAGRAITAGDRVAAAAITGMNAGGATTAGAPMGAIGMNAGAVIIAGVPIIASGGTTALVDGRTKPPAKTP
jgi:hypothetical protein